MNQEIISYINTRRQAGAKDEVTRQELLDAGWPPAEVNESFLYAGGTSSPASVPQPPPTTGASPEMQRQLATFMGGTATGGAAASSAMPAVAGASAGTPQAGIGSKIAKGFFIVFGLLMIFFAVNSYLTAKSLSERGIVVSGTATGVSHRTVEKEDSDGHYRQETEYRATLVYKTNDGVERRYDTGWTSHQYSEGGAVQLFYLPEKPDQPSTSSPDELNLSAIVFGLVGALFMLIGIFGKVVPGNRRTSTTSSLRIGGIRVR